MKRLGSVFKRRRGSSSRSAQLESEEESTYSEIEFQKGWTLCQHPGEIRELLFMKKFTGQVVVAKSIRPDEFRGYTVLQRFKSLGWDNLLRLDYDGIYKSVVIDWMSTLTRDKDSLTGMVDGEPYTITPDLIREHFGVDIRVDRPYIRLKEDELQLPTEASSRLWLDACRTVFGLNEEDEPHLQKLMRAQMTPLAKILWRIGMWTIHPRLGDQECVRLREVYILHALLTGEPRYSFALLAIDDMWTMYERKEKGTIPHGFIISELLLHLGAVSESTSKTVVSSARRFITRQSFTELEFTETDEECILYDRHTKARMTFLKVATGEFGEADRSSQCPTPTSVEMPNQLQPPPPLEPSIGDMNMQALLAQMHGITMESLKRLENNLMQRLDQREQEREQQRERESLERQALLWNMERHRYHYEREQERIRDYFDCLQELEPISQEEYVAPDCSLPQDHLQLRYPPVEQISHYPPRSGSQYYDPSGGDAIPPKFQSFFDRVFGSRH